MHRAFLRWLSSRGSEYRRCLGVCYALILLLPSVPAAGQSTDNDAFQHPEFVFRHWTANDGLPVSGITGIHQDPDGFLWLSTLGGLARFDGQDFRIFDRYDYPQLPTNRLSRIEALSGLGLLLLTESNELILYRHGSFDNLSTRYGFTSYSGHLERPNETHWLFTDKGILSMGTTGKGSFVVGSPLTLYSGSTAKDGTVWVGSENGLLAFTDSTTFDRYTTDDGLPDNNVTGLLPVGSDLFLATPKGVVRWREDTTENIFHVDALGQPVNSWGIFRFNDEVLFATDRGWRRLDGNVLQPSFSRGRFPTYSPGLSNTWPVVDTRGDFWYAANGNVYRNDTLVFQAGGTINQILPNQDGGIWLAHNILGLFLVRPSPVTTIGKQEGLPGENAYGLVESAAGEMWVGLLDSRSFARFDGQGVTAQISSGTPWTAGLAPDQAVWLGGAGLCRVEPSGCMDRSWSGMDPAVRAIYSDSQSRFWIGTQSNLWVRKDVDAHFSSVPSRNVSNPWVRFISETSKGKLLFGTYGQGLGLLMADSLTFWNEASGFPSDNIRSILPLTDEEIWIGSEDAGLIVLSGAIDSAVPSADITVIGTADGLPDNSVHAMVQDGNGNVWINSNSGIYRLDPDNISSYIEGRDGGIRLSLIDDNNGMRNREGNGGMQSAGYRDAQGRIRFPTQSGVAIIDPSLVELPSPRRVTVLSIAANGERLDPKSSTIRLSPEQTSVDIRFSSPHFSSSEPVTYRYRIANQGRDWLDLDTEPHVVINSLPPGENDLELQAGFAGRWSNETTTLSLTRQHSFTESIWFVVLLLALGLGSGVLLVAGRFYVVRRHNERLEAQVKERTATIEQQAQRLAELDELKSHFFANISHELRTPLTLIKGPISDLLNRTSNAAPMELTRQLDVVDRNVDRLSSLVNDILDLTALEAGTFELDVQFDDLDAFIQRVAALFTSAAQNKGITLTVDTPGHPLLWTYDGDRLEHVMVNLIGNALKFTSTGGRVRIQLRLLNESEVVISVVDNGRGIPAADLPNIFDRYYKGDNQLGVKGSGIGLSLCKDLVDRHGGTIQAESEEGVETTFTIRLPLTDSDAPAESAQPVEKLGTAPGSAAIRLSPDLEDEEPSEDRQTILVAEDNPDLLEFVAGSLLRRFNVLTASDGNEAWDLCGETIPDLVITDVMMPGMTGTDFCARLKDELPTSHIPVVMLTAKGDIDSRMHGLSQGADVYLTKPFETRELHAYIDSLLANRKRLQTALQDVQSSQQLGMEATGTINSTAPDSRLSAMDREFLSLTRTAVEAGLADPGLTVEDLASGLHLSPRQFHRKLEAITGIPPGEMVRTMRLKSAAELIEQGAMSLKEIGYSVGFRSESGFRKAFKDQYGVPPSQWPTSD
jgi:signal transduction histidine kinase/DNA-binding response OmpR family regulator/ligand-binding sensor domain-containing protein